MYKFPWCIQKEQWYIISQDDALLNVRQESDMVFGLKWV